MLDVDFLRERPRPDRPIIYRYRSGVLRGKVRAIVRDWVEAEGGTLTTCKPAALLGELHGANLFRSSDKGFTVCDWRRGSEQPAEEVLLALSDFQSRGESRIALFVPIACSLAREPLWSTAEGSAFVIEEPEVCARTLLPVLRYLEQSTDLAPGLTLTLQPAFVSSFDEFLEDGGELPDLIRAFEDRVVTRTDPQTLVFDDRQHRRDEVHKRGPLSSLSLLRRLVADEDSWQLISLVRSLNERRRQGWAVAPLIADVYRITRRLLREIDRPSVSQSVQYGGHPSGYVAQEYRSLLWAALLLAWEDRLRQSTRSMATSEGRGPNIFASAVDQLGRVFLARSSWQHDRDGMEGLWPDLNAALAKVDGYESDRVAVARASVVRGLARRLAAGDRGAARLWLTQLHRTVSVVVERADHNILKREEARKQELRRASALQAVGRALGREKRR